MRRFAAALLPVALLAACDESAPGVPAQAAVQQSDWPPGTVLAIEGAPILIDEIDLASVWIERIEPDAAGRQLRRLALTNSVLPRVLATVVAPEERERAHAEARSQLERLRHGEVTGPPGPDGGLGIVAEGNWQMLGIELWGQAADWPPDEWHLLEEPGRFIVARKLDRVDMQHPTALVVRIDSFLYPYLADDFDLEGAKDDHRLTIVDPDWREIVPERTQYRMGARTP